MKKKKNKKRSKKKNVPEELSSIELFPEWDYPEEEPEGMPYRYRCQSCGYEELIPDYVVDEIVDVEDLKFPDMPIFVCPCCPGDMVYIEKKE